MSSPQVVKWLILGSALHFATVLAQGDQKFCDPEACPQKQCPTVPPCFTFATTTTPRRGNDWPTEPSFVKSREKMLKMHVKSPEPDCCRILKAQFKWNKTDDEVNRIRGKNITAIRLSEDKITSRCRVYEQLMPGCKNLCPLYEMMCKNTREFVEGVQCYYDFESRPTFAFKHCEPNSLGLISSDTEIAGDICELKLSYLKCVERNISAACGWMGAKVGMMAKFGQIIDNFPDQKELFAPVTKLELLDSRCAEFVSHLAKYQSSPSRRINLELLISVAIVVALLAFKPLHTRFGQSSWVLLIVILCWSAENVLSEDAPNPTCVPCKGCNTPKDSICRKQEYTLSFDFNGKCCHLFDPVLKETKITVLSRDVELQPKPDFTGKLVQPSMEKIANHCKLFEKNMPDCKDKCEVSKLICNSPKAFFEGFECIQSLMWSVKYDIPDKTQEHGYMICEKEFNATWTIEKSVAATYGSLCDAKLNYFKCIEQNFTKECGQVGRYLGIRHFFGGRDGQGGAQKVYMLPNTMDPECLKYVNYVGTHLDVSYSASVRNTAIGFVFAFIAAVAKLGVDRHLVDLR